MASISQAGSSPVDDNAMSHAVELLQRADDTPFTRWTDICDDLTLRDRHGNTLLHWAAALGQLRPLRLLVSSGLDVEAMNSSGATPVICAAASCRNPGATVTFLLRHGAALATRNTDGDDAVTLLSRRGLGELADTLQALKVAMDGCPRLFASSGSDVHAPLSVEEHGSALGTAGALSPQMSTVRFQSTAPRLATVGSPITVEAVEPVPFLFGTPDGSGSSWIPSPHPLGGLPAALPARDALGQLLLEERCARQELMVRSTEAFLPLVSGLQQLTVGLYNALADEVFTSDEDNAYGEGDDETAGQHGVSVAHDEDRLPPDPVASILGERHELGGGRVLLVQWRYTPAYAGDGHVAEKEDDHLEWVPLPLIAHSPTVQAYLTRYESSFTATTTLTRDGGGDEEGDGSFGLDRTASRPLDEEERDELERMLGMIPRRELTPEVTPLRAEVSDGETARWATAARPGMGGDARGQGQAVRHTARPHDRLADGPHHATDPGVMDEDAVRTVWTPPMPHVSLDEGLSARTGVVQQRREAPGGEGGRTAPGPITSGSPSLPVPTNSPMEDQMPSRRDGRASDDTRRTPAELPKRPVVWKHTSRCVSEASSSAGTSSGYRGSERDTPRSPTDSRRFVAPSVQRKQVDAAPAAVERTVEPRGAACHAAAGASGPSQPVAGTAIAAQPVAAAQGNRYVLSDDEQLNYQRFLYQSAMERLRTRTVGFAGLRNRET